MPLAITRDFGEVTYETSAEYFFPRGLPGFEDQNRFILMEQDGLAPIVLLQSLQTPALCFLAVSVWMADPEYQVGMTRDDREALGLKEQPKAGDGTLCLAILSSNGEGFTANLLAPVVANPHLHVAVQAVRADAVYSHRHPMQPEASSCL
jgi:flagellar assembly factor FliW